MLNMFTTHLFRFFTLLIVVNHIFAAGSPVLIKTDGKKGNKGGKLILVAGGKCGSPTLIKGGGKKGGELILIGNQNGNCDKPKYHVVKQFVPVPYYVPKPIFKYILRHHYVPVRQVVVKPVPVPVPVKTYSSGYKSSSYGHSGGSSSYHGSNTYDSEGAYSSDSSSGGGGSGLSSSDDTGYSGSNIYGKYSLYGKSGMGPSSTNSDYLTGSSQYHKSNALYHYDGNSASNYGSSLLPSGSTATKVTLLSTGAAKASMVPYSSSFAAASSSSTSSAGEQLGMGVSNSQGNSNSNSLRDSSSSESYFYNSATSGGGSSKASPLSDDYGTRISSASSSVSPLTAAGSSNGYHIAPVYQGPNGQLYSNGQILSKEFLKSNTVVQAFPASASSSKSSTGGLLGMPAPFASSKSSGGSSGTPVSSNMSKDILQQYSAEIEEAKKWFSGLTSKRREDSAENTSNSSSGSGSGASSSEEDASLEKGKTGKDKLGKK